jgi:hypothetical protein
MPTAGVASEQIRSIGYDPGSAVLTVDLANGSRLDYGRVPEGVYREFLQAPSKPVFHALRVRYRGYPCRRGSSGEQGR